jgi:acetylornithine deacetylase
MRTASEHLANLIEIPSVSSMSNRGVIDYAEMILREVEWRVSEKTYFDAKGVEKVNLLASPRDQSVEDRDIQLAFFCHTDTVPFAADWNDALVPIHKNGFIYGCGACDVKGFLACLLTAIESTNMFTNGLRLVLTADEEIGCLGASHLLAANTVRPRRAVIGEPTSLHPARAGKGYYLAEVTVRGEEAHSAHPGEGRSAIYGAARLITAIEEYAAELSKTRNTFFSPPFTSLNVGVIQGGTAKNIVAGECKFQLEWRPLPGPSSDALLDILRMAADQRRKSDPSFTYEIKILRRQPGFETNATASLVTRLCDLTKREATSIPFGSEASILSSIAEEVVVFGPGDMRTAHSRRECVPVNELDEAVSIVRALISKQ